MRWPPRKIRLPPGARFATLKAGESPPPLSEVRRDLFSMDAIFSPARRLCPGSRGPRAGNLSYVQPGEAPENLCGHRSQPYTNILAPHLVAYFDQYNTVERAFLARWLDAGGVCPLGGPKDGEVDVVAVPSFAMHCFVQRGFFPGFRYWLVDGAQQALYWQQVRRRFYEGRARPPIIVVHEGRFYNPHSVASQRTIMAPLLDVGQTPLGMRARVVRATLESNIPTPGPKLFNRTAAPRGWSDGAEREILRRRALAAAAPGPAGAEGEKGLAALAPLLVTLPVPLGIFEVADWPAFDRPGSRPVAIMLSASRLRGAARGAKTRPAVFRALAHAGAQCAKGGCTLCMPGSEGAGCVPSQGLFRGVLRARFCVEPPGDSQLRSHLYVAVAFGCVPVFFDQSHEAYAPPASEVGWWPWRRPPEAADDPSAGALDYRRFSVILNGSDARRAAWVQNLVSMAQDGSWRRLQDNLAHAAALLRTTRKPCDPGDREDGVCDAFSAFEDVIRRAREPVEAIARAHGD